MFLLVMPFSLRNAGNTFQCLMNQILGDLPFCFVYVDNIVVFSRDLASYVHPLEDVFLLCWKYRLTIGLPKCEFVVKEIDFLGHCLSVSGCWPLVKHSAAISAFPQPTDKPGLQRFLGMIIFYSKFLHGAAQVLAPLTDALKGPGKTIRWTPLLTPLVCSGVGSPSVQRANLSRRRCLRLTHRSCPATTTPRQVLVSAGFLLQEALGHWKEVLRLQQRAAGCLCF